MVVDAPKRYVFDSSTLILLAKITVLRRFAETYLVLITDKVQEEVLRKDDLEDACIIRRLIDDKLIKIQTRKIASEKFALDFGLGAGEAEAVQFACKNKQVVATDDWKAIKTCKMLNVKFITAIHCLIALCKQDRTNIVLALEKLKSLEKYGRYSVEIIKDAEMRIKGEQNG